MIQHDKNASRLEEAEAFMLRMREKGENAEEEIKKYADNLDKYVKKHPIKSTLIAGVAGLILGKILAR